jgi:tRNA G18 (ribose-2'-O)-methylase SpoU
MMNRKKLVTEMGRIDADTFRNSGKLPLVVVLDNVRSLHNVGAVFRTSDAFRVESIVLCGITATPPSAEIHKTALGAEDVVDWRYFESATDAVGVLKSEGYRVYSIELCEGSIPLQNFSAVPGERYAVVLGNEVKGVQQAVVDASDGAVEIPQFGTKHSLNVSVTAGMVIWEFAKKCGWVK